MTKSSKLEAYPHEAYSALFKKAAREPVELITSPPFTKNEAIQKAHELYSWRTALIKQITAHKQAKIKWIKKALDGDFEWEGELAREEDTYMYAKAVQILKRENPPEIGGWKLILRNALAFNTLAEFTFNMMADDVRKNPGQYLHDEQALITFEAVFLELGIDPYKQLESIKQTRQKEIELQTRETVFGTSPNEPASVNFIDILKKSQSKPQ